MVRLFLTQGAVADQYADWKRGQGPGRQDIQYLGGPQLQYEDAGRDESGRTKYCCQPEWFILASHRRYSLLRRAAGSFEPTARAIEARYVPRDNIDINQCVGDRIGCRCREFVNI